MTEPISEMDQQLRDMSRVDLIIATDLNRGKRNAALFFGVFAALSVFWFSWTKWAYLFPAALAVRAFLFQMNLLIIASEQRRRSTEASHQSE